MSRAGLNQAAQDAFRHASREAVAQFINETEEKTDVD